jgi:hydrogenase maturation protein HypF
MSNKLSDGAHAHATGRSVAEMGRARIEARRYQIRGIVQGVGFRPFVLRTAERHALGGWVRNDSDGVLLEVQGRSEVLEQFILEVRARAPALARIESVALLEQRRAERSAESFEIHASERGCAGARTLVSPDSCVCEECLAEMRDPEDRRHRYPYINCTNCGPRYSIVRGVPYDRAMTTMAAFPMCERCEREYHDARDRRFHAQPTACWECGPRVALVGPGTRLTDPARTASGPEPIEATIALLRDGAIVAVKGLGGYHLMVDARDEDAVARLRARKRREEKPFAVMSPTLEAVRGYAYVGEREAEILSGPQRPIVLVGKRGERPLAAGIAPGNRSYGAMLAYTPVHHLLFEGGFDALVATSGNVSDEPIAFRDEDAFERLAGIADAFLVGERDIYTRVDDSIARVVNLEGGEEVALIRRARGCTPEPVKAPFEPPPLLAVGPELKSAICLSRGDELFLSHHIGDLKNAATMRSFEHAIEHLSRLLEVVPEAIAHDMHPGYLSTRFALAQERLPTVAVQHHHAHMAACMCEHGLSEPVVGVVFDGAGYGTDGNIWGGEFLVGDYVGFERAAHLEYFRLPGGDRAVEEPYRVALSLLWEAFGEGFLTLDLPVVGDRDREERGVLARMLQTGVRSPLTSSVGRLFDGVAALIGVRERCRYEAQAAIELEQLAWPASVRGLGGMHGEGAARGLGGVHGEDAVRGLGGAHGEGAARGEHVGVRPFAWRLRGPEQWPWRIDPAPMVRELAGEALRRDTTAAQLSLRFHCTVIDMVRATCEAIRERTGIGRAVLSGGVFQNELLLRGCHEALGGAGFEVFSHRRVPTNDGGVALGQAAVAGWCAR